MKITKRLQKVLPIIAIILFSLGMGATYYPKSQIFGTHVDEYFFLLKSEFFELFFIKHDYKNSLWKELDPAQPKIGPYIFGAFLYMHDVKNLDIEFQKMNLNLATIEEIVGEKKISVITDRTRLKNLIKFTRQASVLFSVLSFIALGIYQIKNKISLPVAVINIILVSQNAITTSVGTISLTDSMQLFALLMTLILGSELCRKLEKSTPKSYTHTKVISIGLGLACAFGAGVKSSGILAYIFISLLLGIFYSINTKVRKKIITSYALISVTFFTTMVALHPFLHQNTLKNFLYMFTNRIQGSYEMRALYPETGIMTVGDAALTIISKTILPFGAYNSLPIPGLDLLLFILGLLYSGKRIKKSLTSKRITPELCNLLFMNVTFFSLIFYLKNDWARYYLPFTLSISLIQTWSIEKIIAKISQSSNLI